MKSDICEAVYRQLVSRGALTPRQITAIVENFSAGEYKTGVAVAVATKLGRRVEWQDCGRGLTLIASAERRVLLATENAAVPLKKLDKAARQFYVEQSKRLPVDEVRPGIIERKRRAAKPVYGPQILTPAVLAKIGTGKAFALNGNWAIEYTKPNDLKLLEPAARRKELLRWTERVKTALL